MSESTRFARPVFRWTLDSPAAARDLLASTALPLGAVAILRCPSGEHEVVQTLLEAGLSCRHADTLVYYDRDTTPLAAHAEGADKACRPATPADIQQVADLARRAFGHGYRSHYAASPEVFAVDLVAEGYAEWARRLVMDGSGYTLVSTDDIGTLQGFICCRSRSGLATEIVLNAVDEQYRRQGVYSALLRAARRHSQTPRMEVSTQVWNYAVQRAWAADGYRIACALDTYHIRNARETS